MLVYWLDIIGTAVFAISGVLLAGKLRMDPFGVLVLGVVTAVGGGTIRDMALANGPVFWVKDPTDLVVAISQSGKSASTLEAMRKVQALSLPVFALTSDPQSPIARACDGVLDINTGIESVGFVTRGFSATVLNLLLMALMIGWELRVDPILEEIDTGSQKSAGFDMFYKICIKIITPIAMAFIFAGSISGFFTQIEIGKLDAEIIGYIIAGVILIVFWFVARSGRKKS